MWRNFKFYNKNNVRLLSKTVDSKEIQQFQEEFSEWWDVYGKVKALHAMNKLRVPYIRDGLVNAGAIKQENINTMLPLKGIRILDIGCGAGILSEPLARLGGIVTGVDANPGIIEPARTHAEQQGLKITYELGSIEEHAVKNRETYDAVVASEVIEHVTHKKDFVKACLECLKPSGSIFITTFNKTMLANVVGIILAEKVLGVIPKGTHQVEKFISPLELQRLLKDHGCTTKLVHGWIYNPVTNTWHWCSTTSINYVLHAIKYN